MTGVIETFTVIHVAPAALEPTPYAVVIVDTPAGRRAARADGDLSWIAMGASCLLQDDDRHGALCRPTSEHGRRLAAET
jgi:DUF35 OB-fold domain, acyl-CoA-associated